MAGQTEWAGTLGSKGSKGKKKGCLVSYIGCGSVLIKTTQWRLLMKTWAWNECEKERKRPVERVVSFSLLK